MTEAERDVVTSLWFVALMVVVLSVLLSINAQGGREASPEWTNRLAPTLSCDLPNPPVICTGGTTP